MPPSSSRIRGGTEPANGRWFRGPGRPIRPGAGRRGAHLRLGERCRGPVRRHLHLRCARRHVDLPGRELDRHHRQPLRIPRPPVGRQCGVRLRGWIPPRGDRVNRRVLPLSALGVRWDHVEPAPETQGPPGGFGGVLVDDPADGYLVYFSGVVQGLALLTSTLLYYHGNWVLLINRRALRPCRTFSSWVPASFCRPSWNRDPLGNRARRRREARLAQGVDLVPGDSFAGSRPLIHGRCTGPKIAVTGMFMEVPATTCYPYRGHAHPGPSPRCDRIRSGLRPVRSRHRLQHLSYDDPRGRGDWLCSVRRSNGELRVGWENLQPGMVRPQKDRDRFQFLFPGKEPAAGGFAVTLVRLG